MTCKRRDGGGTQFSNWLREQPEIDSYNNKFFATDIDYVWVNRKKQKYMMLEEKRNGKMPSKCQARVFQNIDSKCKKDKRYCGFYCIVFENTSPENGKIYLYGDMKNFDNKKETLTRDELLKFLKFEYNPFGRQNNE